MKNREEIKNELKELSPFLWEQKNNSEGYDVPKDYFKSLPGEIIGQLNINSKKPIEEKENWFDELTQNIQYFFQPRFALAYASAALLIIAGMFLLKPTDGNQLPQIAAADILSELPDEILNEYISANIGDFDENILTEELADNADVSLPSFDLGSDEELMDELIDDLEVEDLEDLF